MRGISRLAEETSASQEGFYHMELAVAVLVQGFPSGTYLAVDFRINTFVSTEET